MANNNGKRSKSMRRQSKTRSRNSRSKQQLHQPQQNMLDHPSRSGQINREKNIGVTNRSSNVPCIQQGDSFVAQTFNKLTGIWHEAQKGYSRLSDINSAAIQQTGYITGSICIEPSASQIVFQCQLAHGSPTGVVTDFTNPAQLYKKIADCFDGVSEDQILYCTRNTHRVNLDAVFINTLAISDFLFAHLAGQRKEVELVKTNEMLGVTVADNGAGRVYVRRIDANSIVSTANGAISLGDHIEKINGESMIGKRHYQVAQALRSVKLNQQFTMRLISPFRSAFSLISARQSKPSPSQKPVSDPNATIRFNKQGKPVVENHPNKILFDRIGDVFSTYFGFLDEGLAEEIIEISDRCTTLPDFEREIQLSAVAEFQFPIEFLFDLWGTINDSKKEGAKHGGEE